MELISHEVFGVKKKNSQPVVTYSVTKMLWKFVLFSFLLWKMCEHAILETTLLATTCIQGCCSMKGRTT